MGIALVLGGAVGLFALFRLWAGGGEGLIFAGGAAALLFAGILGLLDTKPRVTISDTGLTVRALGRNEIPWHAIRSARIESIPRAGNAIILELNDGTRHRFYADALQISSHALLNEIKAHMPESGGSNA